MTTTTTSDDLLALPPSVQDLLFREARTARSFTDEPVSDEQIHAIHDLVKYGPTASNTQPLRVLLVRSPEARARLVPLMAEGNRERTGRAPLVAILAADANFHEHLHRFAPYLTDGRSRFEGDAEKDAARERLARFNATLQAGYFLVGIRAAGLGAGPMGGFDAAAVDKEFFPEGDVHSLLIVNIGHPAADAYRPRQPRWDASEVIRTV